MKLEMNSGNELLGVHPFKPKLPNSRQRNGNPVTPCRYCSAVLLPGAAAGLRQLRVLSRNCAAQCRTKCSTVLLLLTRMWVVLGTG